MESDSRNQGARAALIDAAIDAFGRDGFDAVSIRRIAEAAGVNAALISYHFGGKEGLYAASVQHIAEQIGARMGPLAATVSRSFADADAATPAACSAAVAQVLDGLLDLLTQPQSTAWARIILREQQDPTDQFETLYAGPMAGISELLGALCARARGRTAPTLNDRLTAATLIGQVTLFRAHRAAVLRMLAWDDIGPDERDAIRAVLHRNIACILETSS